MARPDPHSFTDDTHPRVRHLSWHARVDFGRKQLDATAELSFEAPAEGGLLALDSRGLEVRTITTLDGAPVDFTVGALDAVLGAPLLLTVPAGATGVRLAYRTSPDASALQWLEPAQTLGGQKPFLFSQCQAIHARSVVPCQDTPARRITFQARLDVPLGLTAVMAAAPKTHVPSDVETQFHFEMPQPIPPYLLAFAVGELTARDLSARSRVWSEPGLLDAAAFEFAEVEKQLSTAEQLFGPYDWERFDLLVMPPSFPYGGMENPRLTFVTPTLLAGDRSLVSVIAHELAHSWTGNLVTNINAEHFWLNEGFTVYAERRIVEALHGTEVAGLHAAVGRHELDDAIARFARAGTPELTRLRTSLQGVDPDEAFSVVPYEKGYLFLRTLEAELGRPAFDALLRRWLGAHRFGSASTDDFLAHVEREAPGVLSTVDAVAWVDDAGVPSNAPAPRSSLLEAVEAVVGTLPSRPVGWSSVQWQLFLDRSPRTFSPDALQAFDAANGLSSSGNAEVLVAWWRLALESGLTSVVPQVEAFLSRVGRLKYLRPLYGALHRSQATKGAARALFEKTSARLHPISRQVVSALLAN